MPRGQTRRFRVAKACSILFALFALTGVSAAAELIPRATFPKPDTTVIDPSVSSAQEIVVKFHEGTHVRLRNGRLVFDPAVLTDDEQTKLTRHDLDAKGVSADVDRANEVLFRRGEDVVARLFARDETQLDADRLEYQSGSPEELADLNLYFMLVLAEPDVARATDTINAMNALASVEISYAEPLPSAPAYDIAPPTTIDLRSAQDYKNPPGIGLDGIAAGWANRLPGGRGAGIRLIDMEGGWDKDHEDLPGTYFTEHGWNSTHGSHGAAVLGIIAAADNNYGITGIVPDVALGLSSPIWATWHAPSDTAAAVDNATAELRRGDVLVIEQHQPRTAWQSHLVQKEDGSVVVINELGAATPDGWFLDNGSQIGYLPAEDIQAVYDSIRLATAKGIIVAEAAGNGGMDLDDPFWGSHFDRSVRDSGAILVGAGDNLHSAESFSNFGSRVDMQGWGSAIATLGYGGEGGNTYSYPDPKLRANGGDARQWYTRTFGGTSGATPIVAGAAVAVNGYRLAHGDPLLDAIGMRQWLRATGTPQHGLLNQIGPLPDLSRAIQAVGGIVDEVRPDGVARGWAFHSGQASTSIAIHFYVDGPAGSGSWAGSATTTMARPDVNQAYDVTGSHGFEYSIPNAFRDDDDHTLYVYGIDPTGLQRHVLLDQQPAFNLPNVRGTIDIVDGNGRVQGWAFASQSPSQWITVQAYVDGPRNGGGTFVAAQTTTAYRSDVNAAFGISGSHGFDFKLPVAYRDGQTHTLYVYGIDPRGRNNPLLGQLPFQLNLLPSPSLAPSPLAFGSRAVGSKTVLTATLSNGGPGALDIGTIVISGPFSLDSKTCGTTLPAGQTCAIKVAYQPAAAGWSTGILTVGTPNAFSTVIQAALTGQGGIPQAQLDTTVLDFGPVNEGATTTMTARLSNTGTVPVTIASLSSWGGAGFNHSACPTAVGVGGSCLVTVTFTPTTAGWRGAWLRFDDDGGGPHDLWLEGTGVPVGVPTAVPSLLAFGATDVGRSGAVMNMTLHNTGGANLTVYGAAISRPHWGDFRIVSNGCPNGTVLYPGGAGCSVAIVFTPRATGPRQGTLFLSTSNGPAVVSLAGTGTAASVSTQWPMFGRGAAHGGWNVEETGIDTQSVTGLREAWTAGTNANVASTPAVAQGIAVFGDDAGIVHAVDAIQGSALWDFTTGDAVRSSPTIAQGLVIVGSNDDSVYALDLGSGTLAWSFATRGDIVASPTVSDGLVFVGSMDGTVYALDAATGKPAWTAAVGAPVQATAAVADHVLYVGADNNSLHAYEAARGAMLWTAFANGPIRSSPAVADGRVFVGSEGGRTYAFDAASGQQAWMIQASSAIGSSPAVAGGIVYVGTDSDVMALDAATGGGIWTTPIGARSAPAVANGVVYLSTRDGFLRAFDAWAGTELLGLELKLVGSSPVVVNGTVYIGANAGLIALQP
jgi:serine protease